MRYLAMLLTLIISVAAPFAFVPYVCVVPDLIFSLRI